MFPAERKVVFRWVCRRQCWDLVWSTVRGGGTPMHERWRSCRAPSLWDGCGRGKQRRLAPSVFSKLKRDVIVPCKHIMTLSGGERGEEKLFKSKNIIHIKTTGNIFGHKRFFIISVLRIQNSIVVVQNLVIIKTIWSAHEIFGKWLVLKALEFLSSLIFLWLGLLKARNR